MCTVYLKLMEIKCELLRIIEQRLDLVLQYMVQYLVYYLGTKDKAQKCKSMGFWCESYVLYTSLTTEQRIASAWFSNWLSQTMEMYKHGHSVMYKHGHSEMYLNMVIA